MFLVISAVSNLFLRLALKSLLHCSHSATLYIADVYNEIMLVHLCFAVSARNSNGPQQEPTTYL